MTTRSVAVRPIVHGIATRERVVIENVQPAVDGGRFPVKRIVGDEVAVAADVFADGHDVLRAVVQWRPRGESTWNETDLRPVGNDHWVGSFVAEHMGRIQFNVEAWVDPWSTWREAVGKRAAAGQDVGVDLAQAVQLLRGLTIGPDHREPVDAWTKRLEDSQTIDGPLLEEIDEDLTPLVRRFAARPDAVRSPVDFEVRVDPARARASAWYELFPRSTHPQAGRHGTFRTLIDRLPYIRSMGFDTVYLPPIHPIGRSHRKGRNNSTRAGKDDVGSPWAIGGPEGGHKSVHPALGTLEDFDAFVDAARDQGLDVAMDIAFQCSPDHPYIKEHPEWFRHRPDGSIQYAENPPKKYEDIVPFDFECADADALWTELRSVLEFWMARGISTFRVDNPHTKPFAFWRWLIEGVREQNPDVLFLSEAFTRPRIKYRLAKLGFTHSYTYFAWRNTRAELEEYSRELHEAPVRDFFRPHFWTNTPDILTEVLQEGGRPAAAIRFVLAATLVANYGVYGPAFELGDSRPLARGMEEYLDSEKYQLRHWDLEQKGSLRDLITKVNRARADHPSLRRDDGFHVHRTDNDHFLCYSRRSPDGTDAVLVVVNLDPNHGQAGWTALDLAHLGIDASQPFQVHDLLTDERYVWQGARNFVELKPEKQPAHVFALSPHVRSERDYDEPGSS